MVRLRSDFLRFVAVLGLMLISTASSCAPSKEEVVHSGKSSTALIRMDNGGYRSAFCVHPDGLFVTDAAALKDNPNQVKLTLNCGEPRQMTVIAYLVRCDTGLGLALVRIDKPAEKFPYLVLGSEKALTESMDVVAFGSSIGVKRNPFQIENPLVDVTTGVISSLSHRDGQLDRIQFSGMINPGTPGGPLVNSSGKVIGVIAGPIQGLFNAGINLAIPVGLLERFLARPEITFKPPPIADADLSRPANFRAIVTSLIPISRPLTVELVLDARTTRERRIKMSQSGNEYVATVAPVTPRVGPSFVGVEITFEDGQLVGKTEDKTIRVGKRELKLGDLRSLFPKSNPVAELADGTPLIGTHSGLANVPVSVGGRTIRRDLGQARSIKIEQLDPKGVVQCLLVASNEKGEVGRASLPLFEKDAIRPSFDAIRGGRFDQPYRSASQVTYLKMESSKGDFIGQGKSYEYGANQLVISQNNQGVSVQVGLSRDFEIALGAPHGQFLQVGEYPGSKVSGGGRGCSKIDGKFVVWELEVEGSEVVRLAVDFVQRCDGKSPSLAGMLRFNSNYY